MFVSLSPAQAHVPVRKGSRHEADAPDVDVRLAEEREPVHRTKADIAIPRQHSPRFTERPVRVRAMLECPDRDDPGECRIGKRKVLGVAANEIGRNASQLGATARDDEPPQGDVDSGGANPLLRDGTCEVAGAGPDIQPDA